MLVVNPRQEDSTIPRIELDMVWWVHSVAVAVFAFEIIKKGVLVIGVEMPFYLIASGKKILKLLQDDDGTGCFFARELTCAP